MSTDLSQHDVELGGIKLMLYRPRSGRNGTDYEPARIPWGFGAADAAGRVQTQVVPRIWSDWSGGMGYARSYDDLAGTYHYGQNVCTRWPNVVTPGGLLTPWPLPGTVTAAPSCAFELNDDLYVLCGRYVVRIADGTGAATVVQDLGGAFTATSCTLYRGKAYVGGISAGAPTFIWQYDGTSWTQSADVKGKFLAEVTWFAGGAWNDHLWVSDSDWSFKYTTAANPNPLADADYSSAIRVSSTAFPIKSIARFPQRVFPACGDGIRDVSTDAAGNVKVSNLTPYWGRQVDPSNGSFVLAAENHVYATFAGGLDRVDVTSLERQDGPEWCDVGAYLSNESPIYGAGPLALDRGWVVSVKNNGTDAHVMYGADRSDVGKAGPGPMVWHGSEAAIEGHQATMLHLSSPNGDPRMWIGSTSDNVGKLHHLSLPKAATPLQDWADSGPMRFAPLGYLYQSGETWGQARATKIVERMFLTTRNLGGGALIDLYANAEGGPYVGQGTARRSPRTKVTPRAPAVSGNTIGLLTILKSGSAVPAILEELSVDAEVNVELAKRLNLPVVIARRTQTHGVTREVRVPATTQRAVEALQSAGPVPYRHVTGEEFTANVAQGIGGEVIEDDDGKSWTTVANLDVTLLSQIGGRVLKWGVGDRYASDLVYGSGGVIGDVFRWGLGSRYSRNYVYAEEAS